MAYQMVSIHIHQRLLQQKTHAICTKLSQHFDALHVCLRTRWSLALLSLCWHMMYACMYVCSYKCIHIHNDTSCTVCLQQSGTSWLTCMLGCGPCTLDTCTGWLNSCRLLFCTVLCITRQLLTTDAQTLMKPQFQQVLSGLCKARETGVQGRQQTLDKDRTTSLWQHDHR